MMKILSLNVTVMVALGITCNASEIGDRIAHELLVSQRSFADIESVEFTSTTKTTLQSGYRDSQGKSEFLLKTKQLHKGSMYLFDQVLSDDEGVYMSEVESFDGAQFAFTNRISNILKLSSAPIVNQIVMAEAHYVFMPYLFLLPNFQANRFAPVSWNDLLKKENWESIVEILLATDVQTSDSPGEPSWAFKLGSCIDAANSDKCTYTVFFSQNTGLPIMWERRNTRGDLLLKYKVLKYKSIELPDKKPFNYPSEATITRFSKGDLSIISRITIDTISLNQVDNTAFDPDFSSVDRIKDIDNKTIIAVPK